MNIPLKKPQLPMGSFLPEDYVQRKAELRANLLTLGLFGVVMFCVLGAFFVTNRRWLNVRDEQETINALYTQEAKKIEQLKVLEAQRAEMIGKAEVTAALVEKVPRSVLTAELVRRMPEDVTLLEFRLESSKVEEPKPKEEKGRKGPTKVKSISGKKDAKGKGGEDAKGEEPKVRPPKFRHKLVLVGVSEENTKIADYLTSLKESPLLERVELKYIKESTIEKVTLRKFEVEAYIRADADARSVEPVGDDLDLNRMGRLPGQTGSGQAPLPPTSDKKTAGVGEKKED